MYLHNNAFQIKKSCINGFEIFLEVIEGAVEVNVNDKVERVISSGGKPLRFNSKSKEFRIHVKDVSEYKKSIFEYQLKIRKENKQWKNFGKKFWIFYFPEKRRYGMRLNASVLVVRILS